MSVPALIMLIAPVNNLDQDETPTKHGASSAILIVCYSDYIWIGPQ